MVGHVVALTAQSNPRYYELLKKFEARTGVGVLLNTSLNRRGESMVCSPDDALNMFFGSDLQNLAIGDFLAHKQSPIAAPYAGRW
jgi:carbamoyltransferase